LEENNLKHDINQLAQSINFPLSKILVMDGSRRSDHSNAYFFGLWNKRIVLYDTLLKKMNDREVLSVVGHELGHWKHRHTYMGIFLILVAAFAILIVPHIRLLLLF
jgi:STE24 endopeptidase